MARDDDVIQAHDVFISYAHVDADHEIAKAIAQWLESEGYKVWWDRSLLAGDKWLKALIKNASHAKRVILLWSPQAAKRDWVMTEARIGAADDKLVPLIIEDHPVPPELGNLQFHKLTSIETQKAEILQFLNLKPSGKRELSIRIDDSRIYATGLPTAPSIFIGRDQEIGRLRKAWASTAFGADPALKTNAFVLHAIGGAGKSALMRQFLDELADGRFAGIHKVYGWSAYSQGSGDNRAASAEEFIASALAFFGYDLNAYPIQDAVERGRKLAHLVALDRSLLILDGLEPLQDAPHINGGRLKDRGMAALITGLAAYNKGMLLITSRQELPELAPAREPRVVSCALDRLDGEAGSRLLAVLGVHGKREDMARAVDEVLGHALSLNLLGAYLSAVHGGDVAHREQFRLGEIELAGADFVGDATARYARRAASIMEGTVARLAALGGGTGGEAEIAILHMVGLFDRPAERGALDALLAEPVIPGLTAPFHGLSATQRKARWNVAVERLRKLKLLSAEDPHEPGALDTHPIVRAHFGARLQAHAPEAFRAAHSRLYDFYRYRWLPAEFHCAEGYGLLALIAAAPGSAIEVKRQALAGQIPIVPEELTVAGWGNSDPARIGAIASLIGTETFDDALARFLPDDLAAMRPCFSAIAHGCAAGRHQDAYREVYRMRVRRGDEWFMFVKLGAANAELALLASFYDAVWTTPAHQLSPLDRARILGYTGFALRALGRMHEAAHLFAASLKSLVDAASWRDAAICASAKSELRLCLGDIREAIGLARTSVTYADLSGAIDHRVKRRMALGDALHQAGHMREAQALFEEAIVLQGDAALRTLYSLWSYRYCDFMLAQGQAQFVLDNDCHRGVSGSLLDVGLEDLIAGRAHAALAFATPSADGNGEQQPALAREHLNAAVDRLRRAFNDQWVPKGLIARAAFLRACGEYAAASVDLAEAHEIAARGEMRLHLTDFRLEAARLALAQRDATGDNAFRVHAENHVMAAANLIACSGYKRRLAELEALRVCLSGAIPASQLAPDCDAQGRAIWHNLDDQ